MLYLYIVHNKANIGYSNHHKENKRGFFMTITIKTKQHRIPLVLCLFSYKYNTIYMYSGITSGRVLNGELLYTKILEVNLFAFAYCRQMQTN